MAPVEELDVMKKRKALDIPLQPEPDAFAALTPRESSATKKGRTRGDGKLLQGTSIPSFPLFSLQFLSYANRR